MKLTPRVLVILLALAAPFGGNWLRSWPPVGRQGRWSLSPVWLCLVQAGVLCLGALAEAATPPHTEHSLRLVVFSELRGELYPCDCGNQPTGGVAWLAAALKQARAQADGPVLTLGLGSHFAVGDPVALARARFLAEFYREARVDLLTLGPRDSLFGMRFLTSPEFFTGPKLRFNAEPQPPAALPTEQVLTFWPGPEGPPLRLGVVGAIAPGYAEVTPLWFEQVTLADPARSLEQQLAAVRLQSPDLVLAVLTAERGPLRKLAAKLRGVDLVLGVEGSRLGQEEVLTADGKRPLLYAGADGKHLLVLDVRFGADGPAKLERAEQLALVKSMPPDPQVAAQLDAVQAREWVLRESLGGDRHPAAVRGGFAGSAACSNCHDQARYAAASDPHLADKSKLPAEWRTQLSRFVRSYLQHEQLDPGSATPFATEHSAVPCEGCHGPLLAHTLLPHEPLPPLQPRLACTGCHGETLPAAGPSGVHW